MKLTVAILAGGQARRLQGVDKGLQSLHGRPLVEWVIDAIAEMAVPRDEDDGAGLDVLIIANRNAETYWTHATTIADAADCGEGPMAGVATALRASRSTWLLTVPVDCPNPPRELISRLREGVGTAACAVVHDGERRQPLFALYRGDLAAKACHAGRAGQGPRDWQDQIDTAEVDFRDLHKHFVNLNCRADFSDYDAVV